MLNEIEINPKLIYYLKLVLLANGCSQQIYMGSKNHKNQVGHKHQ
jgi:hypothetical protein